MLPAQPGKAAKYKITVPGTRAKIFTSTEELAELYEQIKKELDKN